MNELMEGLHIFDKNDIQSNENNMEIQKPSQNKSQPKKNRKAKEKKNTQSESSLESVPLSQMSNKNQQFPPYHLRNKSNKIANKNNVMHSLLNIENGIIYGPKFQDGITYHGNKTMKAKVYEIASQETECLVITINCLSDILPREILLVLITFIENNENIEKWDIKNECLKNIWKCDNIEKNIKYDTPIMVVQNVLPILSQPSFVITIGLPGSGISFFLFFLFFFCFFFVVGCECGLFAYLFVGCY